MPRRQYHKKETKPDSIYRSCEITKLINYLMKDGKKSVAEKIAYSVFDLMKEKKLNPVEILKKAIDNVAPSHEVKPKRVGGASYLVPSETRPNRRIFLALNWIIQNALARSSKEYKSADKKILAELLDAYKEEGGAVNKRKQVEKLAEANKAFAHFRW